MLKSLEKLKSRGLYYYDRDTDAFIPYDIDKAAGLATIYEKIQAEIDKYYLPRPLFEDEEPVQIGDKVADGIEVFTVERVSYGSVTYYLEGDNCLVCLTMEDRVSRPPEPDTQEKIDADMILAAFEYCEKYGIKCDEAVRDFERCRHLLERQRKLDGVE